jgi:hypothetical protein
VPSEALLRRVRARLRDLEESSDEEALEHDIQAGLELDVHARPILDVRERVGAVLIHYRHFGELWLLLADRQLAELAAEEARRPEPRAILFVEDIVRLRGKPEGAVRAALEVARAFPGARLLQ